MPQFHTTQTLRRNATKHVYIATPTYGSLYPMWNHSKDAIKDHLVANDVSVTVAVLEGNCHVDDARNDMCRMFLESDATHLFFLDGDVAGSPASVFNMLQYGVDIIAGVYPYKNDEEGFPVMLPEGDLQMEKGLVRALGVPGGFLLLSRKVVQAAYDRSAKKGKWANKGNYGSLPVTEIFYRKSQLVEGATGPINKKRRSGDYQFCADMRHIGFDVWVEPNLTLSHTGTKTWVGNIGRHWMEKTGRLGHAMRQQLDNMPANEAFKNLSDLWANKPFAVDPMLLKVVYKHAVFPNVASILETGTGLTTMVLASTGKVVHSLESNHVWAQHTQRMMEDAGCRTDAIIYAPLKDTGLGKWYDWFHAGTPYDFVFIDGPRRDEVGMRARIFDYMPQILEKSLFIVIDDVDDGDGKATLKRVTDKWGEAQIVDGPRRQFAMAVNPARANERPEVL